MERETPLSKFKGVGDKTAALLQKRELATAGDLLQYYPRAYEAYDLPKALPDCIEGEMATLRLAVTGGQTIRSSGRSITHLQAVWLAADAGQLPAANASGGSAPSAGSESARGPVPIRLTYFNMPYLRKNLPAGTVRLFRGVVQRFKNGAFYMEQPQIFTESEYAALAGTLQPRYSVPQGVRRKIFGRFVQEALQECPPQAEYLSDAERGRAGEVYGLDLEREEEAEKNVHFPPSEEAMRRARNRLVFDEFYLFLAAVHLEKEGTGALRNPHPMNRAGETKRLILALPYELTRAQRQAWSQIEADLTGEYVMNRLLEGDVGSGKTILAFLALLLCAANGRQGAMMAPTEVLAAQHMQSLTQLVETYDLPIRPVLLTGSVKGRARRSAYESIATGAANVVIGTHALIEDAVEYRDLGLVITDEQHRFGVRQRERLAGKGEVVPVLVMSATPIPRTLAIILYGDLQISVLRELPSGRLPIRNCVTMQSDREKAYRFLLREVQQGRQAYVICPAIEESDAEEGICRVEGGSMANVADTAQRLRDFLPQTVRIASLHGRMKPQEKEAVMAAFAAGETDVLVSTTVVEVGINVPNATVMVVENAERFGLAQLHQLRGRIGRGSHQSYCVFLCGGTGEKKPKRLEILEKSNDGFAIAEQDLQLRGPGDLFGVRQSGEMGFVLADIYTDANVLRTAAALLGEATADDPRLEAPCHEALRARLREKQRKSSVDFRTI
ncbi:MAG: ATP-dependent DNA helicase RecG [Eubacteriales bacterium]|nr:ATP-dependent DNA helicase RecG [Eubacteriales bacterium]